MIHWTAAQVAEAAGAVLARPGLHDTAGPTHAVIGSAEATPGALFFGIPGSRVDGGRYAPQALAAGAWGVVVTPTQVEAAKEAAPGVVLVADDPLGALQSLAMAWRRELVDAGATVIGVTGSTGKTTTKELVAAMARTVATTHATLANFNTEIGLPLTILAAPHGTRVLVLEMGMRGRGQIAELAHIGAPQIGIVVNVGPAHLELMGSIEAIAREKGSLLDHLPPGGTAITPAGESLLAPHRRDGVRWVTFGPGGDSTVEALPTALGLGDRPAHVQLDAAAALAAVRAAGLEPVGPLEELPGAGRGVEHPGVAGSTIIDDCYNANPMSMRAALTELSRRQAPRRVAVLGDMLELGPDESTLHAELGELATAAGVGLLATVGPRSVIAASRFDGPVLHFATAPEAAQALPSQIDHGDAILVKGSRGIGLEVVVEALQNPREDV
ncbi:MAG: UDP-N-acetylmuramoyl-tripeptide--D-alanyl-D-alanine ligase [Solirubrobacteraceae bacterium]|nr:UDP-N-acetylmuramoyl-tripeptide--D-alanyl-D-alanine ligase [Solirubrobacteraceae bacterium]